MLPIKETSRAAIIEVARALQPHYTEITAAWRTKMFEECQLDGRAMAALERLNIGTGFVLCCQCEFSSFFENLSYFGKRLAKLQVDTRVVARSLELYQLFCEPFLQKMFGERKAEAVAALEMFSSCTFVAVSGSYFDAQTTASAALLSVLDAELSAGDLPALLKRVVGVTMATFGASVGLVLLRDSEADVLRVTAHAGLDGELDDAPTVKMGQGFSGAIAQSGEPAILPDLAQSSGALNPHLRDHAKALWGVPLKVGEEVIGVLLIGFAQTYSWLPTERELLRAIAERSALAIDRARMTDALRERESRIAELSAHLLKVQEEERKRISRELHDETGQALMVIRLYLGMLETSLPGRAARGKIRETVGVVDRTIEGLRRIIARLSPLVLQELGLIAAIRKEAKDLAKSTGVKARVAINDNIGRLAPEAEAAIYRAVQEALHNVAKHAQASSVNIGVARDEKAVRLVVEDDGIGIVQKSAKGKSFGLAGLRERIHTLGGTVRVLSNKGKGTRVEISVPVRDAPEAPVPVPIRRSEPVPSRGLAAAANSGKG